MALQFLFKLVLLQLIFWDANGNLTKQLLRSCSSKNKNFGQKSPQNGGTSYWILKANELVQAITAERNFNLI